MNHHNDPIDSSLLEKSPNNAADSDCFAAARGGNEQKKPLHRMRKIG